MANFSVQLGEKRVNSSGSVRTNLTKSPVHILIIEDDPAIATNLYDFLEARGHSVDAAADGITGLHLAVTQKFDGILLDLGLPGMDGITLCRKLRKEADIDTPVLMLTARDALDDKLKGFDCGADDYLVKPFAFEELLARIRVQLRRHHAQDTGEVLRFGALAMDLAAHEVRLGDRRIEFTAKEFELLELFMRHPRQVLTRVLLYERIWGYDFGGESNVIEVYIRALRQKLESAGAPRLIHTLRGVGYVLREDA